MLLTRRHNLNVTLRELCSKFPKVSKPQNALDNVAAKLFLTNHDIPFVQSKVFVDERYGLSAENSILGHHNEIFPNYDVLGPNEKFLINKVFFSPSYLLYIIGGIGVGKTRFAHFMMSEVIPQALEIDSNAKEHKPCIVYYDFLQEGSKIPERLDSNSIRTIFLDSFCDQIEAEIYSLKFFDLEQEIGTIWDAIIDEYENIRRKPSSVSHIISQMNVYEATHDQLAKDYKVVIEKRKTIRQKIASDLGQRLSYLGVLLQYIKNYYYSNNPIGVTVIIDNVDREPSLIQQAVKLIAKSFARISTCRTIINARQTTYYQQFDDGSSDPIDVVPYCGPLPLDVVNERIDDFLSNPKRFENFYSPQLMPNLIEGMRFIRDHYMTTQVFHELFDSLCGHSIRKGLILAQNIVCNSVYDPTLIQQGSSVSIGDFLRAILVGTDDIFQANPEHIIENIFNVESYPVKSYLLKVRILRLIKNAGNNGITINRMIDVMNCFGYSLPMLCDALNEMKSQNKRLIWSDGVRLNYDGEDDLVSRGSTRLYISTAGKGYITNLISNIDYIQEIMLDTKVDSDVFGSGWDYSSLEDRFELILRFLTVLNRQDQAEVGAFVNIRGINEYKSLFGDNHLVTTNMLTMTKKRVERILNSIIERYSSGERRISMVHFKDTHLRIYADRIITSQNFESELQC